MIYETLLGAKFKELHPKMQERYSLRFDEPFYARGVMHHMERGSSLFQPVYQLGKYRRFLFPESGQNIPFTLKNTYTQNSRGEHVVHFERTFTFPNAIRTFHSAMVVDLQGRTARDYLGKPAIISADLQFHITHDGGLITQSGAQKLVTGPAEFALPRFLEGRGSAIEGYDVKKDTYTIEVSTYNSVLGKIVAYIGEFSPCEPF